MHIIDQSEQRAIALIQIYFWGGLSLITLKRLEGINDRLEKAQREYKESLSKDRV